MEAPEQQWNVWIAPVAGADAIGSGARPQLLNTRTKGGTVEDTTTYAPDVIPAACDTGDSPNCVKIIPALEIIRGKR